MSTQNLPSRALLLQVQEGGFIHLALVVLALCLKNKLENFEKNKKIKKCKRKLLRATVSLSIEDKKINYVSVQLVYLI
jgi:hypothetical protein